MISTTRAYKNSANDVKIMNYQLEKNVNVHLYIVHGWYNNKTLEIPVSCTYDVNVIVYCNHQLYVFDVYCNHKCKLE